jgi:hypothetical protein
MRLDELIRPVSHRQRLDEAAFLAALVPIAAYAVEVAVSTAARAAVMRLIQQHGFPLMQRFASDLGWTVVNRLISVYRSNGFKAALVAKEANEIWEVLKASYRAYVGSDLETDARSQGKEVPPATAPTPVPAAKRTAKPAAGTAAKAGKSA